MRVSIHQPAYLPWMGYFDKIAQSDLFIYLDTVQFQKGSFQNRNKIRTKDGSVMLTVPVVTKGKLYETALKDITIDNRQKWQSKHLASLKQNYGKAALVAKRLPAFERYYIQPYEILSDLCFDMMITAMEFLGITTPVQRASEMVPINGAKSGLILGLCQAVKADIYLSGAQGRDYLDEAAFAEVGIEVVYQDYVHPEYKQQYHGFEPAMGIVDLLFNEADPARFFRR